MHQPPASNETERKPHYRSYLLRLWCAGPEESGCWRASLDDSHTGERTGFASLEELFAFLMEQVAADGKLIRSGTQPNLTASTLKPEA